ncbi:uncharacterized protein LOC135464732 [Liolophura sinensis]|uniref:uncharacterized protein LOC135464732 n=1 Tax=Liolophura sinensis TaxID=3198878 RepID=UPI0031593287
MEVLAVGASVIRKLARTKRQELPNPEGNLGRNPIFHGCCESEKSWIAPTTATNQKGETVNVIQLDEHKQYFLQESCKPAPGCDFCTCGQPEPFLNTAVVYKDDEKKEFHNDVIKLPGCCKCLNIGRST